MRVVVRGTLLLLAGIALGWLLNDLYHTYPVSSSARITVGSPIPDSGTNPRASAPESALPESQPDEAAPGPLDPSDSGTVSPVAGQGSVDALSDPFGIALASGDLGAALATCIRRSEAAGDGCRQLLAGVVTDGGVLLEDAVGVVDGWLAEFPGELVVGLAGVERLVVEQEFTRAVDLLVRLSEFQESTASRALIAERARQLLGPALLRLTLRDDLVEAIRVLNSLLELDPGNLAWRMDLVGYQVETGDYAGATENLAFMLYDPEYGPAARELDAEIQERLRLANYTEVPMKRAANQFLVSARLNRSTEALLLLDTGASTTVISGEVLDRAGARNTGRTVQLMTAGGPVQARIDLLDSFAIGQREVTSFEISRLTMDGVAAYGRRGRGARVEGGGSPTDPWGSAQGLLGMNFLDRFHFVIDQERNRLFLKAR